MKYRKKKKKFKKNKKISILHQHGEIGFLYGTYRNDKWRTF